MRATVPFILAPEIHHDPLSCSSLGFRCKFSIHEIKKKSHGCTDVIKSLLRREETWGLTLNTQEPLA